MHCTLLASSYFKIAHSKSGKHLANIIIHYHPIIFRYAKHRLYWFTLSICQSLWAHLLVYSLYHVWSSNDLNFYTFAILFIQLSDILVTNTIYYIPEYISAAIFKFWIAAQKCATVEQPNLADRHNYFLPTGTLGYGISSPAENTDQCSFQLFDLFLTKFDNFSSFVFVIIWCLSLGSDLIILGIWIWSLINCSYLNLWLHFFWSHLLLLIGLDDWRLWAIISLWMNLALVLTGLWFIFFIIVFIFLLYFYVSFWLIFQVIFILYLLFYLFSRLIILAPTINCPSWVLILLLMIYIWWILQLRTFILWFIYLIIQMICALNSLQGLICYISFSRMRIIYLFFASTYFLFLPIWLLLINALNLLFRLFLCLVATLFLILCNIFFGVTLLHQTISILFFIM